MNIGSRLFCLVASGLIALSCIGQYQPAAFADVNRANAVKKHTVLVDSIILKYARNNNLPGVAYGVVVDGQLVHAGYSGYTDLANKTTVQRLSAFRIASMSKSFTTMAILILRDRGKLRLDEPASTYIPEMKKMKLLTTDAPAITVRDLMTHRAGFPEDNPYGDRQLADTDAELMQLIKDGPSFSNPPGISYEYSNLGFALLGTIIRNVSGMPYQQFIRDNIFKPLGMEHTYWEYTKVPANELAHGYRWINQSWIEEALLKDGSWGAMGGLITTIEDFSKYMSFHLQAWPMRDGIEKGPLKRSSVREMHQFWNFNQLIPNFGYVNLRSTGVAGYGYGLGISRDNRNRVYVAHGGGLPGFGSHWRIMPDYNIGVVIFSNRTYAGLSGTTLQVLDTLIALAGLEPYRLPSSAILEKRKEQLMKLLPDWKDAERSGIFAENFFPDYPMNELKAEAAALYARAGKILSVSKVVPKNNLRGYFDIEGEKGQLRVYFTLSPEHNPKIQSFEMLEVKDSENL